MDENQNSITQTTKLTEWKKEPSIMDLTADLESAKSPHDTQVTLINKWKDLLNISGSAKPTTRKGFSSVQPKLVRRQAEWRYPSLSEPFLGTKKLFSVTPRTFEDSDAAKQNELLLNWQFDTKLNKNKLIDDFVRSAVNEGTAIFRLGWERETTMVQEEVPVFSYFPITDETQMQALQQAIELKSSDPNTFNNTVPEAMKASVEFYEQNNVPTLAEQVGTSLQEVEKVIKNQPSVTLLNPTNVYIDPSCNGDFDKALFVITSFETNKAELLAEGRYKNLNQINWEGSTPGADPDYSTNTTEYTNLKDPSRKKVVAYEYWGYYDVEGNGKLTPIVATWIGRTIIRLEENPFSDGKLPFVVVPYLPVSHSVYGEPDAELLQENQQILGAVTRGMIDLLGRSANAQQAFPKGMLDAVNRGKYERGEDYEYNPNMGNIIEHSFPEIPQSAMLMLQLQNQEAEALTGVKAFSGGLDSTAYGSVATGIKGMLDAAGKREMAILRRLAKGIVDIGNKIIAMNYDFLSETEVIRVTNREFITINREDLKGNFDLIVDISTAEVDQAKSQDLGFILQTMGPNMDPQIYMKILAEILELKRMPDLAEEFRRWKPEPDPMAEQLKQLELEKAQKEIQKLDSEIAYNQARTQKAMAEANATSVDTSMNQSGVKHLQEMEKQQAQARGNQNLEVTKALLKSRKADETAPDIDSAIGYNTISDSLNNA